MTWPVPALAALGAILLTAALTDIARRKVYNWLTLPGLVLGLALHGFGRGWPGLLESAVGLVVGGLIFFPVFYWEGMGAGDIKLMALVGAWQGWVFALNTACFASLAGGAAAALILARQGRLRDGFRRVFRFFYSGPAFNAGSKTLAGGTALPFAALIALGACLSFFFPLFGTRDW